MRPRPTRCRASVPPFDPVFDPLDRYTLVGFGESGETEHPRIGARSPFPREHQLANALFLAAERLDDFGGNGTSSCIEIVLFAFDDPRGIILLTRIPSGTEEFDNLELLAALAVPSLATQRIAEIRPG